MVRAYIFPNPDHLSDGEIDFEMKLRRLSSENQDEDKRRTLRKAFRDERRNPRKVYSGVFLTDEVDHVKEKMLVIKERLRKKFEYTDVSKLRHLLNRVSAATINGDEEEETRDELLKEIEGIMRSFNQKVTYDPEGDNLGSESESGLSRSDRVVDRAKKSLSRLALGARPKEHRAGKPSDSSLDRIRTSVQKRISVDEDDREEIASDSERDRYQCRCLRRRRTESFQRGRESTGSVTRGGTRQSRERSGRRYRRDSTSTEDEYEERKYSARKSRVEGWDLSFSGDSRSIQVEDFLHRIKKLAKHEGITDRELLRNIHHRLKGEAYDWWFTREEIFTKWSRFEDEIRFRYGNPNRDRGIKAQIREIRQKRGESFIAFITEVERLNQCLQRPFSSRTLFELVWENMRPHYRTKLAVFDVDDLEQLIRMNHKIDANDPTIHRSYSNTREINEMRVNYSGSSSEQEQRSAVFKTKSDEVRKTILPEPKPPKQNNRIVNTTACWNCQREGHDWKSCRVPKRIFCYICGSLGRTVRTCEKKHSLSGQMRAREYTKAGN